MTIITLRLVFLLLCVLGSWSISQLHDQWATHPLLALTIGLLGGGCIILVDRALKGFSLRGLSAASFGLFIGFLISYFIGNSVLFKFIDEEAKLIAQIVMYVVCAYLGMVIALRGSDEFNLVIPYIRFRREDRPERLIVLDTNIIIDGRVRELSATGLIPAVFIVPRFVLQEIQYLADSADEVRRARGKRGLEVLRALQTNAYVEVRIHEQDVPAFAAVDDKLVAVAKELRAEILTNDCNLHRIGELQRVKVLNLLDVTKALRPVIVPGEKLTIKLVKDGRETDQALAYLDDGTMIVVNHARRRIGEELEVTIDSVLQTAAGRMAFAELGNGAADSGSMQSAAVAQAN